jgi:hypothetical protein
MGFRTISIDIKIISIEREIIGLGAITRRECVFSAFCTIDIDRSRSGGNFGSLCQKFSLHSLRRATGMVAP